MHVPHGMTLMAFALNPKRSPSSALTTLLTREIYNLSLNYKPSSKSPSPNELPMKSSKHSYPDTMTRFSNYLHTYTNTNESPPIRNMVNSFFSVKKEITMLIPNLRPISLANTIYKLFTNMLTKIFTNHSKCFETFNPSHEGFHTKCSTTHQLQIYNRRTRRCQNLSRVRSPSKIGFQKCFRLH